MITIQFCSRIEIEKPPQIQLRFHAIAIDIHEKCSLKKTSQKHFGEFFCVWRKKSPKKGSMCVFYRNVLLTFPNSFEIRRYLNKRRWHFLSPVLPHSPWKSNSELINPKRDRLSSTKCLHRKLIKCSRVLVLHSRCCCWFMAENENLLKVWTWKCFQDQSRVLKFSAVDATARCFHLWLHWKRWKSEITSTLPKKTTNWRRKIMTVWSSFVVFFFRSTGTCT